MKQMETIEFEMSSFRVQNFHLRSSNQQILTWSILLAFSLVLWNSIITPSLDTWQISLKLQFFGTLSLLKHNPSKTWTERAIEVTFGATCLLTTLELKTTKKKRSLSRNGFQSFPRSWFGWELVPNKTVFFRKTLLWSPTYHDSTVVFFRTKQVTSFIVVIINR